MTDHPSALMRTAAEVCHPTQVAVWRHELIEALSDQLKDDPTYDDVVGLNLMVQRELTRIIGEAFGMAWFEIRHT